jgi:hypothetical protein
MQQFAAHDSPLDVELQATGLVRGRVVDADGVAVADIGVHATTVGSRPFVKRVLSGADGRFVVTAPPTWRFRIAAHERQPPHRRFSSDLLDGPADDVIVRPRTAEERAARRVTVRAVDAATKAPIERFGAAHNSMDSRSASLLVFHHGARREFRGEAVFDVALDPGNRTLGSIVVDAPGHGFVVLPIPDEPTEPLVAELPAECVLVGQVIDAEDGKPAAGCAVRALPHSLTMSTGQGPRQGSVVTDGEGRYRITGLTEGEYGVQVYGRDRPSSDCVKVTLSPAGDQSLDLEMPKARFVDVTLRGDVPAGCLGTISWQSSFASTVGAGMDFGVALPSPNAVPVSGPRTFRLGPLGNDRLRAVLRLPTRDRVGSGLDIDLGEVKGPTAVLDLPDLRSTICSGRVHLPSGVPAARIAVLAHGVGEKRPDPFARFGMQQFAVGLGSDGCFTIDLPPGQYALQLVDLETGMVCHTEADDIVIDPHAVPAIELRPSMHWLQLDFVPRDDGGLVVCQGVNIEVQRPREGSLPAALRMHSRRNQQEELWCGLPIGVRSMRWLVPIGTITLKVQSFQMLSPMSRGWTSETTDQTTVHIDGPEHRVILRVPPPPSDDEIVRGGK